MEGALHQLNLNYVPAEDRILFRLSTHASEELRFWLTRIYSRHLFDALSKMLNGGAEGGKRELLLAAEHQEAVQQATGQGGPEPQAEQQAEQQQQPAQQQNVTYPLGELPVLLTRLSVEEVQDSQEVRMLKMHPAEGVGMDLRVDRSMAHNLCRLLVQISGQAEWNLDLTVPGASAMASVVTSTAVN